MMTDEDNNNNDNKKNLDQEQHREENMVTHIDYNDDEEIGSVTTSHSGGTQNQHKQLRNIIAGKETRWVARSKVLVFVVLAIATASVAVVTYNYTSNAEIQDFEQRYKDFANQILEVSQINAKNIFDTYDAMSQMLTSFANTGQQQQQQRLSWPFVHMPNFVSHANQVMKVVGASSVSVTALVPTDLQEQYESFSRDNREWIHESFKYLNIPYNETMVDERVSPRIFESLSAYKSFSTDQPATITKDGYFAVVSQIVPVPPALGIVNFNSFNYTFFTNVYEGMIKANRPILSEALHLTDRVRPQCFMAAPVYDRLLLPYEKEDDNRSIVAVITSIIHWHSFFSNLLPEGIDGIYLVVTNTCNQQFTYQINGPEVLFLGHGDYHDDSFAYLEVKRDFTAFQSIENCRYSFHVYPTMEFQEFYQTNKPILYTSVVVLIFVVTTMVFVVYDIVVERRQSKVLTTATKSNAIVHSLFPETVRDRLMESNHDKNNDDTVAKGFFAQSPIGTLSPLQKSTQDASTICAQKQDNSVSGYFRKLSQQGHKDSNTESTTSSSSKPIADLFPHTTVLFGDLVGFTAWSSVREPTQVFTLLESVYNSFDRIARKLEVFKVETIGDCYVAVTGLPTPRHDHALIMATFARQCLVKLNEVVHKLEYNLGPGTSDLSMRFGLHSGPVTAGVLRGEKSRFQLFGDTVNVAARMESTGMENKIQLSEETANLLVAANKGHWTRPRETTVNAKGKGEMQTYWLQDAASFTKSQRKVNESDPSLKSRSLSKYLDGMVASARDIETASLSSFASDTETFTVSETHSEAFSHATPTPSKTSFRKKEGVVRWNVEVLGQLIKRIVAMQGGVTEINNAGLTFKPSSKNDDTAMTILDEVQEIITLPSRPAKYQVDPASIVLPREALAQLKDFVEAISEKYQPNHFHNFEHSLHVVQSTIKLLSRIVTIDSTVGNHSSHTSDDVAQLHKYTYGITSDPLTQFACVFSALIHDVDHPGLPNSRLVQEQSDLAKLYKNKSVAEQHSVDVAWELLMEPKYCDLRRCIFTSQDELKRFRQLVVNCVMATDIVDKELGALRRKRWEDAFAEKGECKDVDCAECSNRKATIVIEHLIQASDVAHTMQHWHVYIKWNERLFMEMYKAYKEGRADKDPSEGWYEGEMGFFDYYIIPLAKKLRECGVFGVSSDEYLNYAQANRHEWEGKGRELVTGYVQKYNQSIQGDSAH